MVRFLTLWRQNLMAPWPTDLSKTAELYERMFASLDQLMKKGEIVDFGMFPDGISGFGISTGDAATVFRRMNMFQPYFIGEVHEIVPYEQAKEILRGMIKAQMEQAK
jgi:hypothetical protein